MIKYEKAVFDQIRSVSNSCRASTKQFISLFKVEKMPL